jgi:hypothetical protein
MFADNNSRLLRWSIKLAELDFIVEHRPGSKMNHIDALSRRVGTVTQVDALDRQNVLREQAKDAFCSRQTQDPIITGESFSSTMTVSFIGENHMVNTS